MGKIFVILANLLAVSGLLLCGISGAFRLSGFYQLAGYESMTIFSVGTGIMVASILIKQEIILWTTHKPTG